MILEIDGDGVDFIIDNIHDLREIILYMLSFQKVVKEDVDKAMEYSYMDNIIIVELKFLNRGESKRKI